MSINGFCYFNGKFYANVSNTVDHSSVQVRMGETVCAMSPCTEKPDGLEPIEQTGISGLRADAMRFVKAEGFDVTVNSLTDWMVPGSYTMQIRVYDPDNATTLKFPNEIRLTKKRDGMALQTYLAVHRATGFLHVDFVDHATTRRVTKSIEFDTACPGGTSLTDYQAVSVPLPADFDTCDVELSLEFEKSYAAHDDPPPYFFVMDPQVADPLLADLPKLEAVGLETDATRADGVWMQAKIPFRPKDQESFLLEAGSNSTTLIGPTLPRMTLKEFWGRECVVSCPMSATCMLFVDNQLVRKLALAPGENVIALPVSALDGNVHYVAVKDTSGSFTFWGEDLLLPSCLTPIDVLQSEAKAPFDVFHAPQSKDRFKSLKLQLRNTGPDTDLKQLAHALDTLEGGYANVALEPLHFNAPSSPTVSVIIPAHNHIAATYSTLCSLLLSHNEAEFEVIVVDDASEDETTRLEDIVQGITVLRNETPQRFIRACNRGADEAKGQYIALLNNDTEVTSGWLDELVAAFSKFENAGLVGSKLLFPDGRLQDAGGLVWGSGNPWNYGRGENPKDPRFCYARQVDYLSGAAMMAPTHLWRDVGGLSSYLEPMYFEDTDFAFKVREAGYETWFIPSSTVYHHEGLTSGKEPTEGFKRYLEENRPKFKRRWATAFRSFGKEGVDPDVEKDRNRVGRVLFIDHCIPRTDRDAGSYAALQEIRLVQSLGYQVTFLPINMANLGSYTEQLQNLGVEVISFPFYASVSDFLNARYQDFAATYITRYYVARDVLEQCRRIAPETPVIFNGADLHFLREFRAAKLEGSDVSLERARQTQADEMEIIQSVDAVVSYNAAEHAVIEAHSEGAVTALKCPWVAPVPCFVAPLDDRDGIAFFGSFTHFPNPDAVLWFVQEVMPNLNANDPSVDLHIYGSGITADIKALEGDHVHPVGYVKSVADMYAAHRVFVAPLRSGAGLKGKVVEALSHGVPSILSPIAAEGTGLSDGVNCIIASKPEDWVAAIRSLMIDDALWHDLSTEGRAFVEREFSFEKGREQMRTIFEAVDLYVP